MASQTLRGFVDKFSFISSTGGDNILYEEKRAENLSKTTDIKGNVSSSIECGAYCNIQNKIQQFSSNAFIYDRFAKTCKMGILEQHALSAAGSQKVKIFLII